LEVKQLLLTGAMDIHLRHTPEQAEQITRTERLSQQIENYNRPEALHFERAPPSSAAPGRCSAVAPIRSAPK
jgi:hypothetical protein